MLFKTTKEDYIEKVLSVKAREKISLENMSLYSFLEPFIIGNTDLCRIKGFPQFSVPNRINKKIWKSIFIQPIFVNAGYLLMLFIKIILNYFKKNIKNNELDLIFFSNARFIDNEGNNVFFDRIIKELKNEKNIKVFFELINPLAQKKDYISIYDYLNFKTLFQILSKKKKISILLNQNKELFYEIFNEDYSKLKSAINFFFKILPIFISTILVLTEKMLEFHKPKICLAVSETELFTKALILNSKKYRCKICTLQFGGISTEMCDLNPTNDIVPYIKFVEGIGTKKILMKNYHYPKKSIVISGSPRYDYYSNKINKKKLRKKFNFFQNDKILIFFDQGIPEYKRTVCEMLDTAQRKFKLKIIIKPHPTSSRQDVIEEYQKISKKNKNILILSNINNREILSISNLAITWFSTVALEALLSKVPLILININNYFPDYLPYINEGSALKAINKKEFLKKIKMLLYDRTERIKIWRNQDKSIKYHAFNNDGKSSERIATIIKKILK